MEKEVDQVCLQAWFCERTPNCRSYLKVSLKRPTDYAIGCGECGHRMAHISIPLKPEEVIEIDKNAVRVCERSMKTLQGLERKFRLAAKIAEGELVG